MMIFLKKAKDKEHLLKFKLSLTWTYPKEIKESSHLLILTISLKKLVNLIRAIEQIRKFREKCTELKDLLSQAKTYLFFSSFPPPN